VLKSGCAIEKLQERSMEKMTVLILMYSIIAGKILNMTYMGRLKPELPCSFLLGEDEWKLRYCIANKVKKEPKKPYTIKEAVNYLGGPKRAPSDGPPGVKTIWLGLMKLYILLATWSTSHEICGSSLAYKRGYLFFDNPQHVQECFVFIGKVFF
jgi:hypothetical protein